MGGSSIGGSSIGGSSIGDSTIGGSSIGGTSIGGSSTGGSSIGGSTIGGSTSTIGGSGPSAGLARLDAHPRSTAPPSESNRTPTAGRTSAGPEGGAVGRTCLREPMTGSLWLASARPVNHPCRLGTKA